MVSQHDLARHFEEGATSGQASNVEIVEHEDGAAMLVGYGHAVYAYRDPTGHITVYRGWCNKSNTRRHAGSQSTKNQYGAMSLRAKADDLREGEGINAAPKVISYTPPQLA